MVLIVVVGSSNIYSNSSSSSRSNNSAAAAAVSEIQNNVSLVLTYKRIDMPVWTYLKIIYFRILSLLYEYISYFGQ